MSAPSINISEASHRILQELSAKTGQSITDVLDQALEAYQRQLFLNAVSAGYAALRADAAGWSEEQVQRQEWDVTLMDGLDAHERWNEDGSANGTGAQ